MKLAVPLEVEAREPRVAITPDIVKKYSSLGFTVVVEHGAGVSSGILDDQYTAAGAQIAQKTEETLKDATFILKVRPPNAQELEHYPKDAILIGMLDPYDAHERLENFAKAGLSAFSMELMPRITRAQSMDVLSSQANLAGYRAVIDASFEFTRALPMMMTAAGTVPAAKVFVMGAGVAGLQAIATAKRMGAVVTATDVRPASKEQVESLGAKFIAVENEEFKQAENAGGYAKEMSDAYKKEQQELVAKHIATQNIVITTALIPGRPAPKLITQEMVEAMQPGSVIVDIAIDRGGNCELSEYGQVTTHQGVHIIGHANTPGRVASSASQLYAKNLYTFLETLLNEDKSAPAIDLEDELVKATLLTHQGKIIHERFQPETAS